MIPPPSTLISDTILKYKEQQAKESPAPQTPEEIEVPQQEGEGEANTISRTLIPPPPFTPGVSTMSDWSNFLS